MEFNINKLPEVISEEHFLLLLDDLVQQKDNRSKYTIIQYLDILGEKFQKFYKANVINEKQRNNLLNMVIEFTNFTDLNLTEDLIGLMFQFKIDGYKYFLKSNLNFIKDKVE